jgi:hypothetical protein
VLPIVSSGVTSQISVSNLLTGSIFHQTSTGWTTNNNIEIDGNLFISGVTTLGGNIVPNTPRGATLGTLDKPFSDIFVSSGSINIAGIPGQPNTTLSNVSGSILVSAGNMTLVGSASFIAQTGSFSYISGSLKQVGDYVRVGNTVLTGSQNLTGSYNSIGPNNITGSLNITGSGFINSHKILTDLDTGSFAITGSNVFISGQTITGSVIITGSVQVTGSLYVNSGSLIMDSTAQTNILATSITNPNNYVIHQFLTSSYHAATYAFSAVEDSTNKVTAYSNYIVAQGGGSINSTIGADSKVTSGAGAPNPTFTVAFSGSYAQLKVTDTGTFTYRGIVQLY